MNPFYSTLDRSKLEFNQQKYNVTLIWQSQEPEFFFSLQTCPFAALTSSGLLGRILTATSPTFLKEVFILLSLQILSFIIMPSNNLSNHPLPYRLSSQIRISHMAKEERHRVDSILRSLVFNKQVLVGSSSITMSLYDLLLGGDVAE